MKWINTSYYIDYQYNKYYFIHFPESVIIDFCDF